MLSSKVFNSWRSCHRLGTTHDISESYRGFHKWGGTSIAGWFISWKIMNPIKMDDLGVALFEETSISMSMCLLDIPVNVSKHAIFGDHMPILLVIDDPPKNRYTIQLSRESETVLDRPSTLFRRARHADWALWVDPVMDFPSCRSRTLFYPDHYLHPKSSKSSGSWRGACAFRRLPCTCNRTWSASSSPASSWRTLKPLSCLNTNNDQSICRSEAFNNDLCI